ncbi:MAG: tryptophan synthase subunit beta [Elusimicrobiota bacterium]|jgi:tryptophan synthase beta chain|nr:tryptophan synthase subunit beta [Elusimicrobiota bacterium]
MTLPQADKEGFFGSYGGAFVPPALIKPLRDIAKTYRKISQTKEFKDELYYYYKNYAGRPSPLYFAANISARGAKIYLKREDLNHTGAHKINHCLGEALLAKKMGKKKIIAETGAGQHGIAIAAAAALFGLRCAIYMGRKDIEKQYPNALKMKTLGAQVIAIEEGRQGLSDAVEAAFNDYLKDPENIMYAIGSIVGPHPFPSIVGDFQSVVGREAREQFLEQTAALPDYAVACVGGGSNAIGLFSGFLNDKETRLIGVEPGGKGLQTGRHAAALNAGRPDIMHGFKALFLTGKDGKPAKTHSVAGGLNYLGVGPQHCLLKETGRARYVSCTDEEAVDAFFTLSRKEGIIPALESAHAVAYALKLSKKLPRDKTVLVNLSGRGDKDLDYILANFAKKYGINI